jgi:protein-disulfide isomerase
MRTTVVIMAVALAVPVGGLAEPPLATVGGRSITRAEVEARVKPKLVEVENQRYEILRDGIDEIIAEEVIAQEAKARGVTVEALEETEVTKKVPAPRDEDVKQVYEENKEALDNAPFDTAKPYIIELLKQQGTAERKNEFVNQLRVKYKAEVALKPPVVDVGTGGRPSRGGGANAPVTIIAFSDYECPFCKRAEATVEQVMKTYGDKVRLVHRDFPLTIHKHAQQAAEAARCAEAQGKFWEYHGKLFASDDLSTDKLKAMAKDVGLDPKKFDECLDKQQFKDAVAKDVADGNAAGVNGTPAFFINGRVLSGAQPFEKFKEIIDEEIAAAPPQKPKGS